MVKCIIVDDEPLAQQVLEKHVRQTPELTLVKKCGNALEAFEILNREKIDLLFLDINMPAMSGIDFIRSLKNPPATIFTTAFSEYAVLSYELEAIDYLMKPITYERFQAALSKYLKVHTSPPEEPPYSYFKIDGRLLKIAHADILYAQSIRDYILLNTLQGNHIVHLTMKGLEEMLPISLFTRVHRSFLIGNTHITAISKNEIELGGANFAAQVSIPVGGNYKPQIESLKAGILNRSKE